jgi:hypothetical protein
MTENSHRALARRREAHEAPERRRLAGAVAAQKRHDFALAHLEADAVQDVALAVESVKARGLEHDLAHAAFPR